MPTGLPAFVDPMQTMLVNSIRSGEWIYEIKFDGYRALAPAVWTFATPPNGVRSADIAVQAAAV